MHDTQPGFQQHLKKRKSPQKTKSKWNQLAGFPHLLGEFAGLFTRANNLVEEDGEVERKAESDRVSGLHVLCTDVKRCLICLLGFINDVWREMCKKTLQSKRAHYTQRSIQSVSSLLSQSLILSVNPFFSSQSESRLSQRLLSFPH